MDFSLRNSNHILDQPPGAVLFDLDGTLLDTEPLYSVAYQRVLDPYGFTYTLELKKRAMGGDSTRSVQLVIDEYNLPLSAKQFLALREQHLTVLFADVDEIDGAGQFVEAVKLAGVPIGLATSSYEKQCRLKLGTRPWANSFNSVVCGDNPRVKKSKPEPDIFLECAQQLQTTPEECIVFEDSLNGILAAKRAGMRVCALISPYMDRQDLDQADLAFSSYRELIKFTANWVK